MTFPSHQQTSVVSQPGERALNLPASLVSAQLATILGLPLFAIAAMRTDHINSTLTQASAQRVTVIASIQNQATYFLQQFRRYLIQQWFKQSYLRWRRTAQAGCQRNSLAINHQNPLSSLAFLGLSNSGSPFFAGANEPSAKVSSQSRCPASSSSAMKVRQTSTQTFCSSQSRRRRQQVLGEGYCGGRSRQRAPVFKTHRMPSTTARFSAKGRPPLGDGWGCGSSGSILRHCSSLNKLLSDRMPQVKLTWGYETTSKNLLLPIVVLQYL